MAHPPDWTSAIFFGLCGLFCLSLTLWPRLWIAISVNRKATAEGLPNQLQRLRVLTGAGAVMGLIMTLLALAGR